MRVLSWNLFHGRAEPPAGRSLEPEFFAAIAGWEWDVALLQEVQPWWTRPLGEAAGASVRTVLTSRNTLAFARRFIWARWPDLIRSNGGGANTMLVRGANVVEHRKRELSPRPERRMLHGVRLEGGSELDGIWVLNLHGQTPPGPRARETWKLSRQSAVEWSHGAATILGGDVNLRKPVSADGFAALAGHEVDHVFGRGFERVGGAEVLARPSVDGHLLSDHVPLAVDVQRIE